jgi:protein-disulfide isomerase
MKKEEKRSSGLPLSIIVLVMILVVVGGLWFYNTSRSQGTATGNRAAQTNSGQSFDYASAPPGAPVGVNMLGPADALVTVEEFADYQCQACALAHPKLKELQGAYAGNKNFRFIFRHFPLSIPGHDKSYEASVATEAAGLQGRFWQMQDQLFRNQQAWTMNPNYRQLWTDYARNIGLDIDRFSADIASARTKERVDLDMRRGRALGVNQTPSVFVNGTLVPPSELNIGSLRRIVDAEMQKLEASSQGGDATSNATNKQ